METQVTKQKYRAGEYMLTVECYENGRLLHRGRFKAYRNGMPRVHGPWTLSKDRVYYAEGSRHSSLKDCVSQATQNVHKALAEEN